MEASGQDLRPEALEERRKRFCRACYRAGIQHSEALTGDGDRIFRHACGLGLEGIVSKRVGSRYVSDRTRAWLKTKNRISAALAASFDHLVGADDKRRRKREAERLCSLEIKNQL
jgi:bifunctional non-homologous end joining protein LigD